MEKKTNCKIKANIFTQQNISYVPMTHWVYKKPLFYIYDKSKQSHTHKLKLSGNASENLQLTDNDCW